MENFEQYLKIAKSITISTEDYIRLMDLVAEETERVKESQLELIKTDNIRVYRVRELKLRGFVFNEIGDMFTKDDSNFRKGTYVFYMKNVLEMSDSEWFSDMDKLDSP